MANSFLIQFVFIYIPIFCNGEHNLDNKPKSALVEGILQKVFNLTLASFTNVPDYEREKMMIKLENKLKKSAQSLHPNNDKFVDLIMEGVRTIISENQLTFNDNDDLKTNTDLDLEDIDKNEATVKVDNELIKSIAKNIQFIAEDALKYAKGSEERLDVMKEIKKKVIESAIKKQAMRTKQSTKMLNVNLLEQAVEKLLNKQTTGKNEKARRMQFQFIDNINVNKDPKPLANDDIPLVRNMSVQMTLPCRNQNKIICDNMKTLGTFICNKANKEISLQSLCDGVKDCFDGSDESDCAIKGVGKVRQARELMLDVDKSLSKNCFSSKVNNSLLSKQSDILRSVLKNQLAFIQKHAAERAYIISSARRFNSHTEQEEVRETVNEVATVITTLSSALERTLCSSEDEVRRFIENVKSVNEDIELPQTSTWSSSVCSCNEDLCVDHCEDNCKNICMQKYTLSRWQCKAVGGNESIPLALICDGKLDCFDETDENTCSSGEGLARFQAGSIYNMILELILTKKKSAQFKSVEKKLATLTGYVETLQKLSMMRNPDLMKVKIARDRCFSELVSIYEQCRYNALSMNQLDDWFKFLLKLNEWLVSALKRSHSGNDRIISPDGCFCREGTCPLKNCSKICVRACAAEPKLTRYRCIGSGVNISLPTEAICNGKKDCPSEDDETDCSEDVCRKHHLILLSHNLKNQADKIRGTNVGEALKSWEKKVSANLKIAESEERPSPKVLRDIVNKMLHDLVMTYAGLGTSRRSRRVEDDVIQEFYDMFMIVINTLKTCGK